MSDEFKLQWSVSLPPVAQYAKGHMMNFRADTTEELDALFEEVLASGTMQKALSVAELLTGAAVAVPTLAPVPSPASSSADTGATVTQLKTCNHGKRTYRSGFKGSKKWEAWFCPQPKGQEQCAPIWGDD